MKPVFITERGGPVHWEGGWEIFQKKDQPPAVVTDKRTVQSE